MLPAREPRFEPPPPRLWGSPTLLARSVARAPLPTPLGVLKRQRRRTGVRTPLPPPHEPFPCGWRIYRAGSLRCLGVVSVPVFVSVRYWRRARCTLADAGRSPCRTWRGPLTLFTALSYSKRARLGQCRSCESCGRCRSARAYLRVRIGGRVRALAAASD